MWLIKLSTLAQLATGPLSFGRLFDRHWAIIWTNGDSFSSRPLYLLIWGNILALHITSVTHPMSGSGLSIHCRNPYHVIRFPDHGACQESILWRHRKTAVSTSTCNLIMMGEVTEEYPITGSQQKHSSYRSFPNRRLQTYSPFNRSRHEQMW